MKKLISMALATVMTATILTGCGGSKDEVKYTPGVRTTTDYTSEWLGLTYTLDDQSVMATDEEINALMQIGADMLLEGEDGEQLLDYAEIAMVFEMMAIRGDGSNNIIIAAEKLMLENMTEDQYIEALKQQIEAMGVSNYTFNDVTSRTINDVEFKELSYVMEMQGTEIKQMYLIKKLGDRMAAITLTYADEEGLNALLAGFSGYTAE